jgi:hypothetical protein
MAVSTCWQWILATFVSAQVRLVAERHVGDTILRDSDLDARFKRDGYLRLPLMDAEVIEALRLLYGKTRAEHEKVAHSNPFHSTQDTFDSEIIAQVDREAKLLLMPLINRHFHGFKVLTANFLVKEPGPGSVLHPHQDWNFVDETAHFSFNIWIPLEPTHRSNGCLRFLPGSHHILPTIRANDNYTWAFDEVKGLLESLMIDVPTDGGECVLLNHAVVHSSYANMEQRPRVALVIGMCPAEAPLRHYVCTDGSTLRTYSMTSEHILNLRKGEPPKGAELIDSHDFSFPVVSKGQIEQWILGRDG